MTKPAIITGISGFVGGFLAEKILQSGGRVLGFSPQGEWLPTSPPVIQDRVDLLEWDLAQSMVPLSGNPESDTTICREIERFQPEVVYHLAAMSIPSDCGESEPTDMAMAVNVEGTRCVVETILKAAPDARLVFISSSHVYAPVDSAEPWVTESSPVDPKRGYGKTKLAAEQIVLDAVQQRGLDAVIARAFQHTGPRQTGQMMLPEWMKQIVDPGQRPIQIHTRDAYIDLLDVRDVVCAYQGAGRVGQVWYHL